MGQYNKIRCPVCFVSIELTPNDPLPQNCPACKEWIGDALTKQGGGTGLNTARATGPGLHPLSDLEQDVF